MSTLKDLVSGAHEGRDLLVTAPHYRWIAKPEEEQRYSEKAIQHVTDVMRGKYKRPRAGRFSPSGLGGCPRAMLLGFAGAPQVGFDDGMVEMMDHGTWTGLKWQAEGITMGWMTAGEVWVEDPDMLVGGSMDGELHDGSIFELKSAAPSVYAKAVAEVKKPKYENMLQVHGYFMLHDVDWASVVFEDRAYGNFHEFRLQREAKLEREVIRRLNTYKQHVESDTLPAQLPDCELRMGRVYRGCPFRDVCHKPTTVSDAQALGLSA